MLRAMQAPVWCADRVAIDWPAASPATAPTRTSAAPTSTRGANVLARRSAALRCTPAGRESPQRCRRADAGRRKLRDARGDMVMGRLEPCRIQQAKAWPSFDEARMTAATRHDLSADATW